MKPIVALAVSLLTLAVFPASSPAPVPPKDCGFITVDSQRYNVRSDRLRCKKTRKFSRQYLARGTRPSGYSCENYGSETAIEFRCVNGKRNFFAIRR